MNNTKKLIVFCFGVFLCGCDSVVLEREVVDVWVWEEPLLIESLGREFSLINENDFEIRVKDFDSFEDLKDEFYESSINSNQPDIVMTTGDFLSSNRDFFKPLDQREVWDTVSWGEVFVPSAHQYTTEGNYIYGVPLWVESLGLIYNFQKYESRVPYSDVPASNWKLLLNDIEFLTQVDNNGSLTEGGIALGEWENVAHGKEILAMLFWQNQVHFFDKEGTRSPILENVVMLQTAEKILEFYESFSEENNSNYSWDYGFAPFENGNLKAFVEGRVSMIIGTYGEYSALKNRVASPGEVSSDLVRVTYFPESIEGNNLWVETIALAQTQSSSVGAEEFLFWLTSQKAQESLAFPSGRPSAMLSVLSTQALEASDRAFYVQAEKGQAWISHGVSVEKQLIFFEELLKLSGTYQQRLAHIISKMRE